MVYLIVWFIFGVVCYWIADFNKERHPIGHPIAWLFAGMLFGIFALFIEGVVLVVAIGRAEDDESDNK